MRPVKPISLFSPLLPRASRLSRLHSLGVALRCIALAAAAGGLVVAHAALPAAGVESFAVQSRELVDLELYDDGALSVLVSVPGAPAPGIYRWERGAPKPSKLCNIASPAAFSFDRQIIIERQGNSPTRLRLYRPADCSVLGQLNVDGFMLDVDARGDQVAAAVRAGERGTQLQLFDLSGTLLASARVGRNVEMGFAPDGESVLNFDLSDSGARAWSLPSLAPTSLPDWFNGAEVTFVAGSPFVKRYAQGTLSIARWPSGLALHAVKAQAATRLRAVSASGAVALVHEHTQQRDVLDWLELSTNQRTELARGIRSSIDHAALSPDATQVAWTLRGAGSHTVQVQRRAAPSGTR